MTLVGVAAAAASHAAGESYLIGLDNRKRDFPNPHISIVRFDGSGSRPSHVAEYYCHRQSQVCTLQDLTANAINGGEAYGLMRTNRTAQMLFTWINITGAPIEVSRCILPRHTLSVQWRGQQLWSVHSCKGSALTCAAVLASNTAQSCAVVAGSEVALPGLQFEHLQPRSVLIAAAAAVEAASSDTAVAYSLFADPSAGDSNLTLQESRLASSGAAPQHWVVPNARSIPTDGLQLAILPSASMVAIFERFGGRIHRLSFAGQAAHAPAKWLQPPLAPPPGYDISHVAPREVVSAGAAAVEVDGHGAIAAIAGEPTPGPGGPNGLRLLFLSPENGSVLVASPGMDNVCTYDADICSVLAFTGVGD